MSLLLEEII